jgi:NAD(P)-dependent dehydrogenase (short-subunit alcohol dehydrogenase family)
MDAFDLAGRVAIVTGGAGLLGQSHAEVLAELGANVVLLDIDDRRVGDVARSIAGQFGAEVLGVETDITDANAIDAAKTLVLNRHGRVDILINNAANNPKVEDTGATHWSRLETLPLSIWEADIAVGLTGAFLCARAFGQEMARRGKGVILNIASDLSLIAPDQRIYRSHGVADDEQMVKPVTYSVVKSGLIGLTKYLATYWADRGVRVNALSPGGVAAGQDEAFVGRLTSLIPLGRMARRDEYKAAVAFLVSDASSYMTGSNLVVDGGRTAW